MDRVARRNQLIWPTADLLPTNHEALGLESFEQMVEFVDPAFTKTPLSPGKSRRVLTTTEKALFDKLGSKQWIANCQPTPPEYDGPERVINYLSNYVQGNVISDARIIDYDGQYVTIRYKDYKAGDVKTFKLERGELVRRFAMHIQPRGSKRLRYSGIFTARGRGPRLAICSKVIAREPLDKVPTALPATAAATSISEEQDPASDDFEETEEHRSGCYCRSCEGELELLGRLKGTETKAMQSLSEAIVFRILSYFAEVAEVGYSQLLFQLRIAWLTPKRLPQPIRDLFIGRAPLTSIECGVLEALVIEELVSRNLTSGIPPPLNERLSAKQDFNHVA
ncbi:MAG: transposase [Pirellulaceae bacterium]|nr:transposase [Pirellulaceae bacterium]